MIHEFVAFGGILFWIIIGVVTLVLAAQVDSEKNIPAFFTLIAAIALIIAFTNAPVIESIKAHPVYVLYGILGYFAVAGLWAVIKWRMFFLPKLFDRYDELRSAFLQTAGPAGEKLNDFPADPAVRDRFNKRDDVRILNINQNRMVTRNKGRITGWMIFWPFSLIGTFIGDFLHRAFTTIYKLIAGGLQRMSDNMAGRYSELN